MTHLMKKIMAAFASLGLLITAMVLPAYAGDPMIDAAKDEQLIGETTSGYLEVVSSVDAVLKRKMDEINALRRDHYNAIAERTGESLETVASFTGAKLVTDEKSGRLVKDDTDSWIPIS